MPVDDVDKRFLGTGWSFPPEFHKRGGELGVKLVSEEEDICESLRILLSTSPGERIMHPGYGCGLRDLVFDNITESAVTQIRDTIERAVLFFEPRIELESVDVNTDEVLEGVLRLQLKYRVRRTNTRGNIVYPFYLLEGTRVRI